MLIIGVTGQTGAGKSTLTQLLNERHGFAVIDADKVAREITQKGSPVLAQLALEFGSDIIFEDGTLNRKRLAELAFANEEQTKKLNGITHPAITELVLGRIDALRSSDCKVCIVDAPLLFGSGIDKVCSFTAAVVAPEDIRSQRIVARDGITPEQAQKRIKSQPPLEFYKSSADVIINNFPPFSLEDGMQKIIDIYKENMV